MTTEPLPQLRGLGASPGRVRGIVWQIPPAGGAGDGDGDVPAGAVLVARMLSPHHAPLLIRAGAVIVEEGGLLQHATTLARELGIPAVVGVDGAVETLPTGSAVEVDGDAGLVELGNEGGDPHTARLLAAEHRLFAHYGLDVSTQTVDIPALGIRTRVMRSGAGPRVLLLHGGSGTSALWSPLIARLQGFTCFTVDRPGAGSGAAFDYTGVSLREHAVTFLDSVLDALDVDRIPIVANSMGGLWSFWLAADRPHRVSGLVQMGCPALLFGTRSSVGLRFPSLGRRRPRDRGNRAVELFRHVTGEGSPDGLPPEFLDCLYEAETRPDHVRTRASFLEALATLHTRDPEMGMGPGRLARVQAPVLFVWGAEDWYGTPALGRRACELLPLASLEVVPAGHLPWLREPEQCAELATRALLDVGPLAVTDLVEDR